MEFIFKDSMKKLLIGLLLLLSSEGFSQSINYNVDSLIEFCQYNLRYLDKKNALVPFYKLSKEGVAIYPSFKAKAADKPEFKLYWFELDLFRKMIKSLPPDSLLKFYNLKGENPFSKVTIANHFIESSVSAKSSTEKSLKGKRIAIDPGHMAGTMAEAQMEEKYLIFHKDSIKTLKETIEIIEGNLTLATALLVKQKLEKEGAEVFLTRSKPGFTTYDISVEEWLKNSSFYLNKAQSEGLISPAQKNKLMNESDKGKFQGYLKNADLIERAKKINKYLPDLTLIIHYNVDEKNFPWTRPTKKNFNMAFVAGNIKADNLEKKSNRVEFLRLLISEDLMNSIRLSDILVKHFEQDLKVPTAIVTDADYLIKESIATHAKGVYSRNLALTRLIHGPITYGESLYQDNVSESQKLSSRILDVNEMKTSERVAQVADAYYKAVVDYFKEKQ